ncbi:hypothetical protein CAPTEDRAFT_49261, partial [Capitella teleta]
SLTVQCRYTQLGREYTGRVNFTSSGRICQRWDRQTPHAHSRTNPAAFPSGTNTLSDAENFCRNPDSEQEGPWCYTMDSDSRWEYCDISFC